MKKILIIIFLFAIHDFIFAQEPSLEWAKSFGGVGNDQGNSLAIDTQGNVYTVGWFSGTVDFDPGPSVFNITATGTSDGFILKLDAAGNFVWAKRIGGSTSNIPVTIKMDSQRNLYISGYYDSTSDFNPDTITTFNLTANGDFDAYIFKLDQNGNMIWAKSVGGSGFDTPNSLALDSIGNSYIIGNFQSTVDFDPNAGISNMVCTGFGDIFILKLDSSGNFIWSKKYGGIAPDNGLDITLDASNNIYTTGIFHGIVDFDPGSSVYNLNSSIGGTAFIDKLTNNGDFIWAKQMGDTTNSQSWSITIDQQNNIYTTGYFNSIADFDPNAGTYNLSSNGLLDVYILKLDSAGDFIWAKSFGGSDIDYASAIRTDALGNVYTTGYFNDTVDFNPDTAIYNLTSFLYYDMYILKLNSSGNFQWAKNVDGNSAAVFLAIDNSDNLYLTGNFGGVADFDFNSAIYNLSSISGTDIFITKYSSTSVSIEENEKANEFNIYPNPNNGQFEITYNKTELIERIEIFDMHGKLIEFKEHPTYSTSFNLGNQSNTVYLVKMTDKDGRFVTHKFIKY